MRKVTKILGKVLSAAVLLLIVLPLALSLLLSINAVQNFVVDRAAQFASRKLETVVRIDRVDIGIFDRITLEGLYVEDYGGDTLLYVGKLHAFITQFGIFSNGFTLRHGRLTDGKFYLREMPDGVMNVKQIVSRMGRKEKKEESDFRLSISALTVENLEFRLEKLQHRNPVYGIDFSDMDIRDIDAVIDNFTIDGGAVGAEIGRFSAREKSGFEIDDFGGKFFLANGCIGMENARLVTPHSNVSIPAVSIVGDSWAEYKEYVDRVSMTVEVRNSMLSSDDVAYFSPKLRDWRLTLRNINLLFDGVVSDFNADLKSLSFGRSSRVHARGRVTGLPKIDDTHFSLTFDDVTTEAADLGQIAANVARKELLAKMSAMIDRAGALRLTGEVEGTLASFDSKFALSAPVGSAEAELAMQPADRRRLRPVKGRIAVTGFRVGELLEQPNLGSVSCEAGLNGVVGKGLIDARVDGSVSQLEFNGYDYDSLRFGGRLTEKTFNGHVRADDPALRFDFQGEVGFNPERPHYDFDLDLIHADLARMHLNRRDSVSVLSALVEARASGRTLDDLNGKVTVGDVVYRYNADTLRTTRLTLDGQNSAGSKYLSLQSEFADATFRSRTDYKTVFEYLRSSLEKYIPLLYDERKARKRAAGAVSVVDDYSVLSVDVKHFTPVADAVAEGHRDGVLEQKPALVNLQCDIDHPTQCMADMLHIINHFGGVEKLKGKRIAMSWAYSPSYGKPLSVPQGVIGLMTRFGMDVVLAHPEGYEVMGGVEEVARRNAAATGGSFTRTNDMAEAFAGADIVYPKSWAPFAAMQQRTGTAISCHAQNHILHLIPSDSCARCTNTYIVYCTIFTAKMQENPNKKLHVRRVFTLYGCAAFIAMYKQDYSSSSSSMMRPMPLR